MVESLECQTPILTTDWGCSGFSRKFRVEGDIIKVGGKSLHAAQTRVGVGMGGGLPPSHWGGTGGPPKKILI